MTNPISTAEGGGEKLITGAVNAIEAAAVAIFAELNPGVRMDDADFPHYEAAAKAAFAQAPNADAIDARDKWREVMKTALTVLCAARHARDWQHPMMVDFNIAINGINDALTPPNSNGGMETTKSAGQEPDEPQEGTPALPHHRTPTHPRHKGTSPSASRDRVAADLTGVPQEERGWQVVPVASLVKIYGMLPPPPVTVDDKTIRFEPPNAVDLLHKIREEFSKMLLAAAPKPQAVAEDAVVEALLGFASFKDGSFELIVQANGHETTLEGKLRPGQLEQIDRILPTCVFVRAALTKDTAQGDK